MEFRRCTLSVQHRSGDDEAHTARQIRMRTSPRNPVTKQFLDSLEMLKAADIKADAAWRFPIIVCASNYERVLFNFLQAKRFAKAHGEPLLFWYKPFRHV